jgi:exosortase E/protease (VPEID-CTERM system)
LGFASFLLLALTVLRVEEWLSLVKSGWLVCLIGFGLGGLAFVLGQYTVSWWRPLSDSTFALVRFLLSLATADVVCEPEKFLIGTSTFQGEVGALCSGFEGIGLVWVFLAAYLWLYRHALRFPQALLLVPIGTVLIWFANGLRITILLLIGSWWTPVVAEGGFHSQAGWLAFNAVGLGLVAVSYRWRFFCREEAEPVRRSNPAAPLLVPFVVLMAALMVCAAFSTGFDYLYPLRVLAVAVPLWWFRRDYSRMAWSWSWPAVGLGVLAFVVWMALELSFTGVADDSSFGRALDEMPGGLASAWLVFRVLGFVVTVPLAEELAFRGYLIRRLQRTDFQDAAPGGFTWFSFLMSSLLFGLLHGRWVAGTMAGMMYAAALYRRGKVGDAVLAHAVTNALIALYVLATGAWFLWM